MKRADTKKGGSSPPKLMLAVFLQYHPPRHTPPTHIGQFNRTPCRKKPRVLTRAECLMVTTTPASTPLVLGGAGTTLSPAGAASGVFAAFVSAAMNCITLSLASPATTAAGQHNTAAAMAITTIDKNNIQPFMQEPSIRSCDQRENQ
jgi:hypothetical protein